MQSASRIIIAAGGRLGAWALEEIKRADKLIGADKGALFLIEHGFTPDLSLGDFDSVSEGEKQRIQAHSKAFEACDPVWKDDTDTDLSVTKALEMQPSEIRILGGLGTRFDHSLANVHLLLKCLRAGIPAALSDEYNEIMLTDSAATIHKSRFPYASLLPLSAEVTGITLEGFQYPLQGATLTMGRSLGISNRLKDDVGHIRVASGLLLIMQCRD